MGWDYYGQCDVGGWTDIVQVSAGGRYHFDDFKRAVVVGSVMASFVVEKFGPDNLLALTQDLIDGRIRAFRALCAIPDVVNEPA